VTGKEFIRRVRRLARKRGVLVEVDESAGRGDHMKLYFGNRRSTLPGLGELKTGTFHGMCKQLGIDPKEL
jgi:mRNA interferase HicA